MANDILFGKEEFNNSYNNIIQNLHTLLPTEDLEKFEIDTNIIFENLSNGYVEEEELIPIGDLTDDNLYEIFRKKINEIFDSILLKYGIRSEVVSIFHYEALFTMLNHIKNNVLERETYRIIINGNYNNDETFYMLIEDHIENPTELLEYVEIGEYFFNLVEDMISVKRNDSNIEMLLLARELYIKDIRFGNTVLFTDIMENRENIMLDLKLGLTTINNLIKNNIDKYFIGEKLVNVEGLILEISFTYLYFNKDNSFRLSNYVNKNYLEETFKLTLDGTQINNIVNTIKIGV